jgi:hypothetical protein
MFMVWFYLVVDEAAEIFAASTDDGPEPRIQTFRQESLRLG